MPRINPEQLESEADELLKTTANPPAEPDTDEPGQAGDEPGAGGGDEPGQGEEPTAGEPDDKAKPGDKPNDPPPEDTGEDGLSLDNARERIRNAQARMHRATQEAAELRKKVASQDGELSAVRSELSGLKQQLETLKQKPPEKPDTAADELSDTDLQALAEEYPTIAKPFIKTIGALNAQVKALGNKLATVEGAVNQTAASIREDEEDAATKTHFDAIRAAHPDAFELFNSEDFKGWLDRQPPAFADIMDHGTAPDVIYVFDSYKKAVGITKPASDDQPPEGGGRIQRARQAAQPSVRQVRTPPGKPPSKTTFTRQQIDSMSPKEFEEREAEIDEAVAEGRVI